MSDVDTSALVAKGREMFGIKPRCAHPATTLVQHTHVEYGWFACWQCDHCGQITRQEVTADDLDKANDAPWLDVAMYLEVTRERLDSRVVEAALAFFGKAAR